MPQRAGATYPYKAVVHAVPRPALRDGVWGGDVTALSCWIFDPWGHLRWVGNLVPIPRFKPRPQSPDRTPPELGGELYHPALDSATQGHTGGIRGDCPRRSIEPAPFSPFSHRAARSSIQCKRGHFPLPHGRGQKTSASRRDWRPPPNCHSRSIRAIQDRP